MKELWTTNPFHLVNGPFAEIGYNSSEPNIVPGTFCWQLAGPPRAIRLLLAQHPPMQADALIPLCAQAVGITGGGLPVSALLTLCAPSACFPRNTRRALCMPSARQLTMQCPSTSPQTTCQRTAQHMLSLCKPFVDAPCTTICCPRRTIRLLPAQHPSSALRATCRLATIRLPTHGAASVIARRNIRWHSPRRPLPLQAIRWHEAMPLTARTNRQREPTP